MKMIAGYLEPTAGFVRVNGSDVVMEPIEVKRAIGYLPEGSPCYGEMSVLDFLNFIADIRCIYGARRRERIEGVVHDIHLEAVLNQTIDTLSKGFKRRVGLAQAILHDPDVLIMDEPTDGLDPNQKHEVRTLITKMSQQKSIIISTHILEEVGAVCSRSIVIASGRLLFDGTPDELCQRAADNNIETAFRELTLRHYEERGESAQS